MNPLVELLLSVLLLVSSFFTLVGSIGLVRFNQFFKRLHAPTKATTMGVGSVLVVSVIYHALIGNGLHPHELLITVFLVVTSPISAHMMSKASLSLQLRHRPQCPADETPNPDASDADTAGAGGNPPR